MKDAAAMPETVRRLSTHHCSDYDRGLSYMHLGFSATGSQMSILQLNCPLCTGLFQVEASAVGAQVACPHCRGAITIPGPPPQSPSPPPQQQAPGLQLACPACQGAFQVGADAAGKQVACPHCRTPIMIPSLPAAPSEGVRPSPSAADALLPPGAAGSPVSNPANRPRSPVSAPLPPSGSKPSSASLPPKPASGPSRPLPAPKPANAPASPLPPGMNPPPSQLPPSPAPASPLPPGMNSPAKPASRPVPAPQKTPEKPSPTTSPIDSLLPPGASDLAPLVPQMLPQQGSNQPIPSRPVPLPQSQGDSLLPPGADSLLPPGAGPGMPFHSPAMDLLPPGADSLLPPGAGQSIGELAPKPLPNALTGEPKTGTKVSVRDPVKTIRNRGVEVELRQFTPEEKDRRRLIKNAIVFIVLSIVLMAVMLILGRQ